MSQQNKKQKTYIEGDIFFIISDIVSKQIQSERRAAAVYSVPRITVQRRRAGQRARCDCEPNSKRLTNVEEEVITRYILNLNSRGFPPALGAVQDMADKLLAERGKGQVGEKWPRNFVNQTESLTTRFNRAYDC